MTVRIGCESGWCGIVHSSVDKRVYFMTFVAGHSLSKWRTLSPRPSVIPAVKSSEGQQPAGCNPDVNPTGLIPLPFGNSSPDRIPRALPGILPPAPPPLMLFCCNQWMRIVLRHYRTTNAPPYTPVPSSNSHHHVAPRNAGNLKPFFISFNHFPHAEKSLNVAGKTIESSNNF